MFAAYSRGDSLLKKGNKERAAENAGDAKPESLIPVRSWTTDAMSERAPEPLAPPLAVAAFIACVSGAAALADCAILATLFKHRLKTGVYSIIIQMVVADVILIGTTAAPELWSLNFRTWPFGTNGCVAYQGMNVFTCTLSTYLLIAMSLHTLTTIRLEEKTFERRIKRNDDEEIQSSQHSLVANSDSSTPPRTMKVDYRRSEPRIPVALPTLFVWILAVSLSIPEFILAAVVRPDKNVSFCTLDFNYLFNVHATLAVFNLFLPLFLISIASVFVMVKLTKSKMSIKSGVSDNRESIAALKLSLWLICVHVLFCVPRFVVNTYRVYSSSISGNEPALDVSLNSDPILNLGLRSAYLIATVIRPTLCIIMLPQIRIIFKFNSRISDV